MTDENERYRDHRHFIRECAERLPGCVLKQVMMNMEPKWLQLLLIQCEELRPMARICLWTNLRLPTIDRIKSMMECFPDPREFAGYIESLEIPAFLDGSSLDYINAIGRAAHQLRIIKIGEKHENTDYPYLPNFEGNQISTLTWGGCRPDGMDSEGRIVPLSVLEPYPHLTTLNWCLIDHRIGTVQSVLAKIDQRYPNLKSLEVPWTDHLDGGRWDYGNIPTFAALERIKFRFDHESKINLSAFVRCLREFYERAIPVEVGWCSRETALWLTEMYSAMWTYEFENERDCIPILHWLIQNNQTHLLRFTDFPPNSPMYEAMCEAVARVRRTNKFGLRIQIALTFKGIHDILRQDKISHLRLVITLQNLPGHWVPNIIKSNCQLRSLIVVLHEVQNESGFHGNCTYNPVPLIPGQDVRRNSQIYTTRPYQLVFRVDRKTTRLRKCWKFLSTTRTPAPSAASLMKLDMDWPSHSWDQAARNRYIAWENEIIGWLDLSNELDTITVVLNKDPQIFGRWQESWHTK